MLVIESIAHEKHKPDWCFTVGKDSFHTRDVPERIAAVKERLTADGGYEFLPSKEFPTKHIKAIHPYHDYLMKVCSQIEDPETQFLPDVFPGQGYKPFKTPSSPYWMGYYCSSAVTPIMKHTYAAAKSSAEAALTGAELLAKGKVQRAYALCRPPGHHAGPRMFGGYCYFNNAATAAHFLSKKGKVAILDIDYHHGDGTQEHFISRSDVVTCSIHGDPDLDFPFVTGYTRERGKGRGKGANHNFPIPLDAKAPLYMKVLKRALAAIKKSKPKYLVIAAGFDTFETDPVGHCKLKVEDYSAIGEQIAQMGLPTLICQEGGYNLDGLGECVSSFLGAFKQ